MAPWTRSDSSSGFDIVLESVPSAGSTARREIDGLANALPALTLRDLQMVVSELVDNGACGLAAVGRSR